MVFLSVSAALFIIENANFVSPGDNFLTILESDQVHILSGTTINGFGVFNPIDNGKPLSYPISILLEGAGEKLPENLRGIIEIGKSSIL
jgi:hypothetical protein